MTGRRPFLLALLVLLTCVRGEADDLATSLARAREAAQSHRYSEVIELMTPYNSADDPEVRYIAAAEIGRAHFHLGRYQAAHRAFQEAVRLHPERVETALYLEATSYLIGDKAQALSILREVLRSGARDLYLAVTLPGERRFFSDPEVQDLLEEFAIPLEVDLANGTLLGVALGETRSRVAETLAANSSDPSARGLTASAGPFLIWAFIFDSEQRLTEILVQAEDLFRYTPYRLDFGDGLDWRATPAFATTVLGAPSSTMAEAARGIAMTWELPNLILTLDFAEPRPPRLPGGPEGAAMLRTVRMQRPAAAGVANSLDRMDE